MSAGNPSISGYTAFIRDSMQISTTYLPADSPWIAATYNRASLFVNKQLAAVISINPIYPNLYCEALYNLAGHFLVEWCPDQSGQTYFFDLRKTLSVGGFVAGVIQSSSDEGTSMSLMVPKAFEEMTMLDLATLKTPWGRYYMACAQQAGPSVWGRS